MKRLVPVLLALMLLFGLMVAGCGGDDETTTTASTPQATTATTASTPQETTATTAATPQTTATTAAAGETYYLRWAQFGAATNEDSKVIIRLADRIMEKSGGRLKIELFWSDSLVPMFEALDAVRLGSAEMATFPFGPFGGMDPRFASSEMPLFYNTIEAQVEAQAALMPAYSGVFEEKFNQKALTVQSIHPLNLGIVKKPVKVLDDWKGLLTQTISPAVTAIIEAFGAIGAPASPIDVYELLQKGTVDATVQSIGKFTEAKLWEVCENLTNCSFISASTASTINLDVWNKLPKDLQDLMLAEAAAALDEIQAIAISSYNQYLEECRANMAVYDVPKAERDKWKETVQPIVDGMLATMGDFAAEVVRTADEANAKYPYPY